MVEMIMVKLTNDIDQTIALHCLINQSMCWNQPITSTRAESILFKHSEQIQVTLWSLFYCLITMEWAI